MVSGPSLKQVKQVGKLSLKIAPILSVEEDEEIKKIMVDQKHPDFPARRNVIDEEEENETEEDEDIVQPLISIRSTGSTTSGSTRSLSPATPVTAVIVTPAPLEDRRFAGSSPPRKAPIGTGVGLVRKESKWRKSVYGLSDVSPCHPHHQ